MSTTKLCKDIMCISSQSSSVSTSSPNPSCDVTYNSKQQQSFHMYDTKEQPIKRDRSLMSSICSGNQQDVMHEYRKQVSSLISGAIHSQSKVELYKTKGRTWIV